IDLQSTMISVSGNYTWLKESSSLCTDATCVLYAVMNTVIFTLGVAGNGVVIWIAGFKMKKSVVTTWYLSLAVSDFIYCCILPFGVVHKVKMAWIFGSFMCKVRYFIKSLNMYSSIFIFATISMDRCVVSTFPVWAQNKRTTRKASLIVLLVWVISALLSTPSALFRDKKNKLCSSDYKSVEDHIASVVCRVIFGFVIPLVVIITSYVIIMQKLKSKQMANSKKPFKIMTALIVTFLICWLPFHIFSILSLNYKKTVWLKTGKEVGVIVANANSCLNPFLYAFMGKDFKKQCYAVLTSTGSPSVAQEKFISYQPQKPQVNSSTDNFCD
uniref:Chemerin chemokine-like receptor 1 n=1 Tax=Astyanax mexicanus TaxID=7994 RepID=A0A8B9H1Z5_ASTMX